MEEKNGCASKPERTVDLLKKERAFLTSKGLKVREFTGNNKWKRCGTSSYFVIFIC